MVTENEGEEDKEDEGSGEMTMDFDPDFRKNDQKKARGKVLSSIIEEVYETYGNSDEEEEDEENNSPGDKGFAVSNALRSGNKQHRRVSSARTIPRLSKLLTSSSGAESPLTL